MNVFNQDYRKRLWIADAPAGKWSSGPVVLWNFVDEIEDFIDKYTEMGYRISGPYDLSDTEGKLG